MEPQLLHFSINRPNFLSYQTYVLNLRRHDREGRHHTPTTTACREWETVETVIQDVHPPAASLLCDIPRLSRGAHYTRAHYKKEKRSHIPKKARKKNKPLSWDFSTN